MMISGIHGDWWAWKCATCGFEAKSQRTVNYQQCVAEAIVSCHIKSCESPSQNPADSHQIQQLAAQVSTLTAALRLIDANWRGFTEALAANLCDGAIHPLEGTLSYRRIIDEQLAAVLRAASEGAP